MTKKQVKVSNKLSIFSVSCGIILSLIFILISLRLNAVIKSYLISAIDTIDTTLTTTTEGFDVIDNALIKAQESLVLISESIEDVSKSLDGLEPVIESTSTILGDDFSLIIVDVQTSIDSAAAGSQVIDNALSFLTSIPLVRLDYQPEVPLHVGLENLSKSLDDLPYSIEAIQSDLTKSAEDIGSISRSLGLLSEDLVLYDANLIEARGVVSQYEEIIDNLQDSLDNAYQMAARWLTIITIASVALFTWLLWMLLVFLSVFLQPGREINSDSGENEINKIDT